MDRHNIKFKWIMLMIISLLIIISSIAYYIDRNSPKRVIEKSFKFQNEKNIEKLIPCYTSRYRNTNFGLDNIKQLELINIELLTNEDIYNSYFRTGNGKINGVDRKNIIIYKVNYNLQLVNEKVGPQPSGIYEQYYILVRDGKFGKWKIDAAGY